MTTSFKKSHRWLSKADADGANRGRSAVGVTDLAFMALSTLANSRPEMEVSASEMAGFPEPHVAAMARLMADTDSEEAEALVADLINAGVTVQELCLSHLTPAARELGRLWECDLLPFTEVSMAAARMQTILRTLPGKMTPNACHADRGALFAATPGETHTLGVLMAADYFQRLGWDVGALVGLDHDKLLRQILADDRPVVGLSCAGGHTLGALRRIIHEVRARRPEVVIVVSGAVTHDPDALALLPDCDGILDRLETAELDIKAALANARQSQSADRWEMTR